MLMTGVDYHLGYLKNKQIEYEQRGYGSIDTFVCSDCFDNESIKTFIKDNTTSNNCDYCKNKSVCFIAAPLEDVIGLIVTSIQTEWEDANNCVGWDSSEGGWQHDKVIDTYDLIADEFGSELGIENDILREDIINTINDLSWCPVSPLPRTPFDGQ